MFTLSTLVQSQDSERLQSPHRLTDVMLCSDGVFLCLWMRSELQTEALRRQSFEQKCESWMSFLQRMEDGLTVDMAGSYIGLREQLCTHKV